MRIFLKILLFLSISYLALFPVDWMFAQKAKDIHIDKPSYIISCKNLSFTYIVGGSSRTQNNFNTNLFVSLTVSKGFNIGYGGTALCQNYLTLYLFLKHGNKTKNYIQQVEDAFFIDPKLGFTYPFNDYFFIPYMGEEQVDDCFKKSVPLIKYYMWKYVPMAKYAEFNNYYQLKSLFFKQQIDSSFFKYKGYNKLVLKHKPGFPLPKYFPNKKELPVDPINIFYLDKIRQLCIDNNINFIIYSSPLYQENYLAYKSKNLHDTLLNYVTSRKIRYYNFMVDEHYKGSNLYLDEQHLNAEGTDLFTKQLADSLKKVIIY